MREGREAKGSEKGTLNLFVALKLSGGVLQRTSVLLDGLNDHLGVAKEREKEKIGGVAYCTGVCVCLRGCVRA